MWSSNDEKGTLFLIGSHFNETKDLSSLTKTDMDKSFSRMLRFLKHVVTKISPTSLTNQCL